MAIDDNTETNTEATVNPSDLVVINLGDIIQVNAAPGLVVREDNNGYFSATEPTAVTVTTRIIRLLEDGDLVLYKAMGDSTGLS